MLAACNNGQGQPYHGKPMEKVMEKITSIEQLEQVYGQPVERALWKEIDHINPHYRQFIEASPFLILATFGEK